MSTKVFNFMQSHLALLFIRQTAALMLMRTSARKFS
jgi:hypothetical protein